MNSADLCRQNGWTVGTVLEGDDGFGPDRIVITLRFNGSRGKTMTNQTNEESILAKYIGPMGREALWNLSFRDWKKVSE